MFLPAIAFALFQPLLIRRAKVDITPPEPLPLGGYTERHGETMKAGGDPLYARCLEVEQGSTKVAIVSVEMLTIPESLYREVENRIPKDVHLFMQATHTHCAPDSQMLNDRMTFAIPGIATYRKRWLVWYADRIAGVVASALAAPPEMPPRIDATIAIVAANRARRKGGKPDPRLISVATPQSLLFTYFTAHPTIYDENMNQTRGDWPGLLATKTGAIVLNGALGDISPAADGATVEDKFKTFFRELSTPSKTSRLTVWTAHGPKAAISSLPIQACDLQRAARPTPSPSGAREPRAVGQSPRPGIQNANALAWAVEPIPLDAKKPHPDFAKHNGIPEALAKSLVDKFAPPSDSVVAVRVGSLAIVGIPGEPTSILGNQIEAAGQRNGFQCVLVCSHVNGWMGYILDPTDYDQGGYEAELSFYGRDEGEKVVEAARQALADLAERPKI
ncbi:MAG TPA: hypothetical protein VMI31_09630 [Fimbriimonadaceae bacterium]|nr:hypothetical protein [Fimbriimonadaceae bacterium]